MENNLIQATVDYVHNLDWSDIFTNITSNKLLFDGLSGIDFFVTTRIQTYDV